MSETQSFTHPLTISFMSGKGGVGKTMLAVACAKELSLRKRTLIIDLDFFNRGLTGLLGEGIRNCGQIEKPGFLFVEQSNDSDKWNIVQVSKNLFHIYYPDLSPEDMQKFETLNVDVLKESLQRFVAEAATKCECDCVVIDCHGGPDNSSFAAGLISDHSILVSEPDRITFYGTLNFLRQLKKAGPDQDIDLHLVFNKIVPAFSGLFLTGFYNRLMKGEFAGRPLLALFPLEVYLTKEFEKTPFLTSVYPLSWLARKTRVMLYDLLKAKHRDVLAPVIRSMPRWMRAYRRVSLGRPFPLLNLNVIMPTIVTVGVVLVLFMLSFESIFVQKRQRLNLAYERIGVLRCLVKSPALAADQERAKKFIENPYYDSADSGNPSDETPFAEFYLCREPYGYSYRYSFSEIRNQILKDRDDARRLVPDQYKDAFDREITLVEQQPTLFLVSQRVRDLVEPYLAFLGYLAVLWLILALLTTWTNELDKRFTYSFRLRRYGSMSFFGFTAVALWFAPLLIVAAIGSEILRSFRFSHFQDIWRTQRPIQAIVLIGLGVLTFAVIMLIQIYRIYRDSRYEGHYFEDAFRFAFLIYLLCGPWAIHRIFMHG